MSGSKLIVYGFDPVTNGFVPLRVAPSGATQVDIVSVDPSVEAIVWSTLPAAYFADDIDNGNSKALMTGTDVKGNFQEKFGAGVGGTGAATYNTEPLNTGNAKYATIISDISIIAPISVTVTVEGWYNDAAGSPTTTYWRPLLTSAAITAAGQYYFMIGPGLVAVPNLVAQCVMPPFIRVTYVQTDTGFVGINSWAQWNI